MDRLDVREALADGAQDDTFLLAEDGDDVFEHVLPLDRDVRIAGWTLRVKPG
jgi:hypothetical protein